MAETAIEARIRARMPIQRLLAAYLPLTLARWLTTQGVRRLGTIPGVRQEWVQASGVPCLWVIPERVTKGGVLLYLHGGGFVFPLSPLHVQMVAFLVQRLGTPALLPEYRLAPQHPFPAALEDCVTAYRWLLERGTPAERIVVAGDSAGGNLTITTAMRLRDDGAPLPAALAALSPVGDLATTEERARRFRDPLLHPRAIAKFNRSYGGPHDLRHPLISPVYGDWSGLPPLFVFAGEDEVLREDAERIAACARAAGVSVRSVIYPRMWHVWQLHLELPQAVQALEELAQFLAEHLDHPSAVREGR